jgi:poly(beta-D-mannuronate) lyase
MSILRTLSFLLASVITLTATEHSVRDARELASLEDRLVPGDVVVLAAGEWRDQALVFRARGTEEKPIELRGSKLGGVVLLGSSTLVIDGEWLVVRDIVIRDGAGPAAGIELRGKNNRLTDCAMIGGTYKHFVRVFGVRNRVDHCWLEGKTSAEPTLQIESEPSGPNDHVVERNYFGPRAPLGANGGETIRVGYSFQSMNVSRTVVQENLFERCDGEIEIISSKSCENIYRANTFLECDGMLTLRHGDRCLVDGNFFLGNDKPGTGGIRVIGEGHVIVNNYMDRVDRGAFWITAGVFNSPPNRYVVARRCLIAFNTVLQSRGPYLDLANGLGIAGRTVLPTENTIANNLFVLPAKGAELRIGEEGADWKWLGNVIDGGEAPAQPGFRRVAVALERGASGLWRPASGAPTAGAAEGDFSSVSVDFDGQPRPAKKDVGCDQASTAPVKYRPLVRADVGPSWSR